MCIVELINGQPFECLALRKSKQKKDTYKKPLKQHATKISKEYGFDITKANKISYKFFVLVNSSY